MIERQTRSQIDYECGRFQHSSKFNIKAGVFISRFYHQLYIIHDMNRGTSRANGYTIHFSKRNIHINNRDLVFKMVRKNPTIIR